VETIAHAVRRTTRRFHRLSQAMTTDELLSTSAFGRRQDPSAHGITTGARNSKGWEHSAKRMLDVVGSLAGLLLLSPLLLAAALFIKVSSPGPVLYRQERIGLRGRQFRVWKFRSMRCGSDQHVAQLMAEHGGGYGPFYKMRVDPRITPVGRFLRRSSIDELPQLINVLKGEMSLIGPRPHVQAEVDQYAPEHHRRLFVKPGLTGLWQISGRSEVPRDEAVLLDLYYVDTWTLRRDLRILLKTPKVVATARGAY
jgi:exopolysaccharide biosynthesis polyprenyl glycosylphosphotransferase